MSQGRLNRPRSINHFDFWKIVLDALQLVGGELTPHTEEAPELGVSTYKLSVPTHITQAPEDQQTGAG